MDEQIADRMTDACVCPSARTGLTCDPQHLQADQGLQRGGSQGAQVVAAEVQQGQGGQARQGLVPQQLDAVVLQMELL